jgi:hypothetical protein
MSPLSAAYPVEVPGSVRVLVAATLVLLSAVGLVLLVLAFASPTSPAWLVVFALLWLTSVSLLAMQVLAFPTRLELGTDGVIRFVCPTRIVAVPLSSIQAIRPGPLGLLVVAHDRGTIRVPVRPTGLADLATRVKAASARAVLIGI